MTRYVGTCTLGTIGRKNKNITSPSLTKCPSLVINHDIFIQPPASTLQYPLRSTSYCCCLLSAPSFSIPSHPAALPANSSTLPYPSRWASRFSLAAFMASMPSALSAEAETFHVSLPVTAPIADCEEGVVNMG
jgi:hypothetical protein